MDKQTSGRAPGQGQAEGQPTSAREQRRGRPVKRARGPDKRSALRATRKKAGYVSPPSWHFVFF